MILSHSIIILEATNTLTDEGVKLRTWAPISSRRACVMPLDSSKNRTFAFSLSGGELSAYLYRDALITDEMRARFDGRVYEIRSAIHWNIHTELILVPLAGEP